MESLRCLEGRDRIWGGKEGRAVVGSGGSGWKPEMNTGTQSLSTVPGGLWPLGEISLPGKFLFFCSDSWPRPGQPQGDVGILNQESGAKMEELSQPRAEGGLGGPTPSHPGAGNMHPHGPPCHHQETAGPIHAQLATWAFVTPVVPATKSSK